MIYDSQLRFVDSRLLEVFAVCMSIANIANHVFYFIGLKQYECLSEGKS